MVTRIRLQSDFSLGSECSTSTLLCSHLFLAHSGDARPLTPGPSPAAGRGEKEMRARSATNSEALTDTPGTDFVGSALVVARAAVVRVRRKVDTAGVAPGQPGRANIVTPAVLFAVRPVWTSAFPATTIAAAPELRARAYTPGSAGPREADWRRFGTDVATGTAVVGIGTQVGARAVTAVFSALDALIDAQSGDAGDRFVRTRRGTRGAT